MEWSVFHLKIGEIREIKSQLSEARQSKSHFNFTRKFDVFREKFVKIKTHYNLTRKFEISSGKLVKLKHTSI